MTDPEPKFVSRKLSLAKLAEQLQPPKTETEKILRNTATDLIKQVKGLVTLDAPLPTSELSRYLTMVCLAGIHDSHGPEQRDWVRIINSIMRTEITARRMDSEDEGAIESRLEQVEHIVKAATNYQKFTEVEVDVEESGNGAARAKKG